MLDRIGLTSWDVDDSDPAGDVLRARIALLDEVVLELPGLAGFQLVLGASASAFDEAAPGAEFTLALGLGDPVSFAIKDLDLLLRIRQDLLRPVERDASGAWQVVDRPLELRLTGAGVSLDLEGEFKLTLPGGAPGVELPAFTIGESSIVIEADKPISLHLWPSDSAPPNLPSGWRGVYISHAAVHLPHIEFSAVPSGLEFVDCSIGSGGFSGELDVLWTPGTARGSLLGTTFSLSHLGMKFVQSTPVRMDIEGEMTLPFFDQPLGIDIGLGVDGALSVALSARQPAGVTYQSGMIEFEKPNWLKMRINSLGFAVRDGVFTAKLGGAITPTVAGIDDWPTFDVRELSIDSAGNVHVDGGWLDLPSQYAIDFFGFGFEITKLGFGSTEDGGRWVGFSGALKLVEGMPAGASVEGLRITWYDDGRTPAISFNGVGVEFEVPDVLRFKGEVAYRELPDNVRRFDGAITLELMCLDMTVDGMLVVGTAPGYTFFAIYLDAELPAGIPLFATGLGLYGFAGLFALNMEPNKRADEQWYAIDQANSWYHRGTPGVTDLRNKWKNQGGSLALGAGVTIGTVSDNGFAFSGKLLLALVFPGPILLLEGRANILTERAKLGAEEPIFRALAVLDNRAGVYTFGLDARYRYGEGGELIDVRGSTEAFFNLADASAWHLYMGRKHPTEQRIRADIFRLFEANAYVELGARRLAMGAWIGFAESWTFGPARVALESWIEGNAEVSFKPPHYSGDLWLHGKVEASAFGVSVGLSIDARLTADAFAPFLLKGEFDVCIALPLLPPKCVSVPMQWGPIPAEPPLPLPIKEIAVEHIKTTASWPLPGDGDRPLLLPRYDHPAAEGFLGILDQAELDRLAVEQAAAGPPVGLPVVPLDGRPHITFGRAANDPAEVGNKAQLRIDPEWERVGDPTTGQGPVVVRYSLARVALHKRAEGAADPWTLMAQTPAAEGPRLWGSWAPVPALPDGGGPNPAQTKLWLWSTNPFNYTRRTGGAWDKWFTAHFPAYPCPLPPAERQVCINFNHLPLGRFEPDGGPAELAVSVFPSMNFKVEPLHNGPANFTQALCSPTRGFEEVVDLVYRRGMLEPPRMQCKAISMRIVPGGGQRQSQRTCVRFTERAVGTTVGFEAGAWFYRLEPGRPGEFLPAGIIEWWVNEINFAALDCSGTLVIQLMNPAQRVDVTLSQASDAPPAVEAKTQVGSGWSISVDGPYWERRVTLTGTAIEAVLVNAGHGQAVLYEICLDRDYELHLIANDGGTMVGPFPLVGDQAIAVGRDLRWARVQTVAPYCALQVSATLYEAEPMRLYEQAVRHTQEELARWSQPDFSLEPYGTYRLSVVTRVEVKEQPDAGQTLRDYTITQFAYFRTQGPPGLAELSLPRGVANPEEITLRDREGRLVGTRGTPSAEPVFKNALNDLAPYVRQTIPATVPAPGEKPVLPRPVYRAYDVGIAFNENSYVETMYRRERRDLALYLFDAANNAVRNTVGSPVVAADHWSEAEELTLTRSEELWVRTINASGCVNLDTATIRRDTRLLSRTDEWVLASDTLHEARLVPLLLHEDFSQGLAGWTVRDDGAEGGPSAWRTEVAGAPPAPVLRQASAIRGGSAELRDPIKPGTVLLRADDPRLPSDHPDQPVSWTDYRLSVYLRVHPGGAVGVVVRDRGPGDTLRFSMGPGHWTLVRVVGGVHSVLASGEHSLQSDRDYLVTVEAVGTSVRVHLNGSPLVTALDEAGGGGSRNGRIGLYCWNDSNARFTDVRVDDFRANAPILYRFGFVTSRFANFFHQAHSFQDEVRQLRITVSDQPDQPALLPLLAASGAASDASSTRAGPSDAEARAFEYLLAGVSKFAPGDAAGLDTGTPTLPELQATRVDAHIEGVLSTIGFLVRSPEPIDWRRATLEVLRASPWPRSSGLPGDVKITEVTFGATEPNEESVTLLLRNASDLAGVVLERLDWAPGADPASLPGGGWTFVDEGDQEGPSRWTVGAGSELLQRSEIRGAEPDDLGTCALAGDRVWMDFRLRATLRSEGAGAIGVVFRYRDPGNCYRFSMSRPVDGSPGQAYRRLVSRTDGKTRVLWEDAVAYAPGQPYAVVLECEGEVLTGALDGQRLFAVQDRSHEAGQLGLYCCANPAARFAETTVATRGWTVHHAFPREERLLPAGTRLRLYSGNPAHAHDEEAALVRRFIATGTERGEIRLPAEAAVLRVRAPKPDGGHSRRFLPEAAYTPVQLMLVRKADGTAFFLVHGVGLQPGEYRLRWTYHRDNRGVDPEAPVLSQAGVTAPERASIDLPWRTLWIPERRQWGVYPSAISDRQDRAAVEKNGTEILVLKSRPGPLRLHIDTYPWSLAGGEIAETDAWILGPSGQELWHGERIDLEIRDANVPLQTRDGTVYKRLEHSIDTTETGVFRILFGSQAFPLYQRLTDDLPEALLVKPAVNGAVYRWGDSRGTFLNLGKPPLAITLSTSRGGKQPGRRIAVVDADRLYRELFDKEGEEEGVGLTVERMREIELQAGPGLDGTLDRMVASGWALFGSSTDVLALSDLAFEPPHLRTA